MITQEELKKLVHYDPETGVFTRLTRPANRTKIGEIAGYKQIHHTGKTYRLVRLNGKQYQQHRLVFLYMNGAFPSDEVDHISGDGTDNRWVNLRAVDRLENKKNVKRQCNNTSGIVGITWSKQSRKWRARIQINQKDISLGYYDNIFDAACARKNAQIKYGFHPNHGSERGL
jgi:hypothetical protein